MKEITLHEARALYLQPRTLDQIADSIVGSDVSPIDAAGNIHGTFLDPDDEGRIVDYLVTAMWDRGLQSDDTGTWKREHE